MIKVMWFLQRAEHLTLAEFRTWWVEDHCKLIAKAQSPYLKRYIVNVREEEDNLVGKPAYETRWDGVAEQWFETEEDFNAAYSKPTAPVTRDDTRAHTSRMERIVVREYPVDVPIGMPSLDSSE